MERRMSVSRLPIGMPPGAQYQWASVQKTNLAAAGDLT
jgi:hypothetical protein